MARWTPPMQWRSTQNSTYLQREKASCSSRDRHRPRHRPGCLPGHPCHLEGRSQSWPPFIPEDNPDFAQLDIDFFQQICDFAVEHHSADVNRIYLVGVSQGGGMANLLTAECSDRIAATVCNCGWLPDPLGASTLETPNKCPMLFIVGAEDKQVPPNTVRKAHDAFQQSGHPCEWQVLPRKGHGWNDVNELVWKFLRDQRRQSD